MNRPNLKNETIKRVYGDYLRNADGKSEATIRQIEKAIDRFEQFIGRKDFGTFDQRQVVGSKKYWWPKTLRRIRSFRR
jgi:hypothetical protein